MAVLFYLFGLVGGAASALQGAVNGRLGVVVGPLNAALVSTVVGLTSLLAFSTAIRQLSVGQMLKSPPHLLVGGVLGAFFVTSVIFVVPRLGVVTTLVLAVMGQLTVALVTDQLGLFGNPRIQISPTRALGVVLVLAGFALARS